MAGTFGSTNTPGNGGTNPSQGTFTSAVSGVASNPTGMGTTGPATLFNDPSNGGLITPGVMTSAPTSAGFQSIADAQTASLNSIQSLVQQYMAPTAAGNTADFTSGLGALNASTNAQGANNTLNAGINSIIGQYDPNSAFNQQALNLYNQAQNNYTQTDLGANSPTGMTNIGQMFDAARQGFTPYTQLGSAATGALSNLQGLNGTDAQTTAVNNLLGSSYVQGQLQMGEQGVAQQSNAGGMARSGAAQQALMAYGQQLAGNTIQQQVNNLTNDVSIGNSAQQTISQTYTDQNAAEFARAGALSTLQTAPTTLALNENEQALQGYSTQQQSQGALQSYMNNYMNTMNNAQQAQYTDNYNANQNYTTDQAAIAAGKGQVATNLIANQASTTPHYQQIGNSQSWGPLRISMQ